jgi:hypothetical protein
LKIALNKRLEQKYLEEFAEKYLQKMIIKNLKDKNRLKSAIYLLH